MTSTRIVTILEFIVYIFIVTLLPSSNADVVGYGMDNITQQFQDFEAEFGTDIGPSGLMGILVNAVPADACKTLKTRPYPPNNENLTINAFVLIARGGCDFAIKVLNAQKASYNAAIVYNLGSDDLLHMGTLYPSIQDQINIPSVFVGQTSGLILNSSYLYFYENNPYVKIREGDAPFSLRYYIYPFIAVIGCSFLVLLLFVGIRAVRDRHRRRRNRLSRQRLKQLPTKQFRKGDEYDVCAICLEEYDEGDTLRLLPCNHAYHCKCVDPWLTSTRRVCPLCKRRVLSDDESTDSDASDDSGDDEEAPLLRPPSSASSEPHFASNQPHRATGYTQENPTLPPRGRGSSHLLGPPTRAYSAPVQFENPILEEFGEDGDDNRSLASTESILPCDDTPHGSACDVTRHACDVTPHLPQSSVDVASAGESLPSPPVASPDHPPFLPPVQDEQRSAKVHEHSPSHEYSCDEEDDVSGDDDDVSYDVIDEEVIDEVQPDDCPPPAPRC